MRKFSEVLEEYLQERDRLTGDFYDNLEPRYIGYRLEGRYRMEDLAKEMDAMIQGVKGGW